MVAVQSAQSQPSLHMRAVVVIKDTEFVYFKGHSIKKIKRKLQNAANVDNTIQKLSLCCFKVKEIIEYWYAAQLR